MHLKRVGGMVAVVFVALLMGIGIQLTQEFRFYALESNHLFLFDADHVANKVAQPGGIALLMASFLTQFMRIPYVGVCMVVALYLLMAWVVYKMLRKWWDDKAVAGLSLLPVVFLFLCMENDYYRFQGHIAFFMLVLALYAYASIAAGRWKLRLGVGLLLVPVLYGVAGSVAVAFVCTVCLIEWLDRGYRGGWSVVYPLVALGVAYVLVATSKVDSWESALTPFMYYNWPSTYFFPLYAWITLPLIIIASWGLAKMNMNASFSYGCAVGGMVLAFYLAGNLYTQVHSKNMYRFLQEQYWAEHGEWDRIIETADRRKPVFFISYLNLALAQKGQLLKRMGQYKQQSVDKLMYPYPNLRNGMSLQSDVYMAWGYVGAARQAAFDANLVTPGECHPRQLKVLVQTNLVLGSYKVAEKYITLLEKTLYYREWATSMRRFLNRSEAIKEDRVLGELYRALPATDEYVKYEGLTGDMRDILDVYPSQPVLSQFYQMYQLLEKEEKK